MSREGTEIPVSQVVMAHRSPTGEIDYLSTIMRDIRERKRAEEYLSKSERKFSSAFDLNPNAMAISDIVTSKFIDVNKAFAFQTGYSREEIIGKSAEDLQMWVNPEDRRKVIDALKDNGEIYSQEVLMRAKGGIIQNVLFSARFIEIEHDAYLLSFAMDITERKRLEEQLLQAQKMEAVGQLAGGVAHDFNNLLQAILGYLELIFLDMDPADPNYEYLTKMKQAGERAAALTRQLLAFSRRQVMQLAPLDINQVVSELLQMLDRLIGKHIELGFNPCKNPCIARADKGQIEQVLTNLCLNARDAMPNGGRLLLETENVFVDESLVKSHEWDKPGKYLCISVTDSGCGMDKETLRHIFDPFFTTKDKHKGTGLGLAMVYGIIHQHRGVIKVFSEVGKGTSFKIYLPEETAPIKDELNHNEQDMAGGGGAETILLAEDEEMLRNLAYNILSRDGYHVLTARDGQEALEIYREHADKISLLFLDILMPRMSGRAVYDAAIAINPGVKCLFASGYSQNGLHPDLDQDNPDEATAKEMDPFVLEEGLHLLHKPYRRTDLLSMIRKILDNVI